MPVVSLSDTCLSQYIPKSDTMLDVIEHNKDYILRFLEDEDVYANLIRATMKVKSSNTTNCE